MSSFSCSDSHRSPGGLYTLLIAGLMFFVSQAASASYTNLVVFGDSLSDTGNISTLSGGFIPAAPYAAGRFSNGPLYTDVLASGLGLSSLNSLSGGSNYAYGGATNIPNGTGTPSLVEQSDLYLTENGGVASADALYVVFGGGNDLLGGTTEAEAIDAANALVGIVANLVSVGAFNILVPNLPDLGITPHATTSGTGADLTARTVAYNNTLAAGLGLISGAPNIMELDLFAIMTGMAANPGLYGFSNTTDVCYDGGALGGGNVCADPDQYLFWDSIHPTAVGHAVLGDIALSVVSEVPLPAAMPLLLSALGMLAATRRLQRR